MFQQTNPVNSRRQGTLLGASIVFHLLLLGWVLHSPAPIFVAPSSVVRGEQGSTLTRIYLGGYKGVTQEQAHPQVVLPHTAKPAKGRTMEPPPPKMEAGNETTASARTNDLPGGSPYGSLYVGKLAGLEIRPALPVISPDPVFGSDLSISTAGDVIVEVTIDEQGNIVEKRVLQSLGPAIDQRVLAALEQWHFLPASRSGVPIPSKQDVYYHFPR